MKALRFIFFNAAAWGFFHLTISAVMSNYDIHKKPLFKFLFKSSAFEKSGETWNTLFKIKAVKDKLPDSSSIMPGSFNLSNMEDTRPATLKTYINETNRAELTHWLSILPAPVFFLWNPRKFWVVHVLYALLSNLPFILAQRYNRPRLEKLYHLKTGRKG